MIQATQPITGCDQLSHSSEACFLACPRKFCWAYELGWRPIRVKKPLRMGGIGHVGIDALATGTVEDAVGLIDSAYDGLILESAAWPDPRQAEYDLDIERVTVQCLVQGYAAAWASSRIQILESEAVFDLPVRNPITGRTSRTFRQVGKRDRVGQLPDGRLALMETKFVGQDITIGSDFRQVLAINQQVSKYILAARADGHDVQTCLYDAIRKPTIKPTAVPTLDDAGLKIVRWPDGSRAYTKQHKPRQAPDPATEQYLVKEPMTPKQWQRKLSADIASRPEYYYQRFEIPRLDQDLLEYEHELWWIARAIRECRRTGQWFRNSGACRNYNTLCAYYPLCAGHVDTTCGLPAGFRQAEVAHEELQDEPDASKE